MHMSSGTRRKATIYISRGASTALFGVGALALASPAGAQESGKTDPTGSQQSAEAGAMNQDDPSAIVVTAQRREERLQDVPASVTALGAEQLEVAGIQSTKELTLLTPGLNMAQSSFTPQPVIRGTGARGSLPGDESVVPVYVDGVYQPFGNGAFFELNNVDRVEVLKGPQGTLYGRNATGGAVNIVTRTPSDDFSGNVELSYGTFNERRASAYLTGPIAPRLTADLALLYSKDDGYVRDVVRDVNLAFRRSFSGAAKLRYEASDNDDIRLSYSYTNSQDNTGFAFLPLNKNTVARRNNLGLFVPVEPYEAALTFTPYFKLKQHSASLIFTHEFSGAELKAITGYQKADIHYKSDSDGATPNSAAIEVRQGMESLIEEVILTSTGDHRFNWLAGGMYFDARSYFDPSINLINNSVTVSNVDTKAVAAYGELKYAITDTLTAAVGGRYSWERKDLDIRINTQTGGNRASWEKFTPSATLTYQPSTSFLAYAKWSQAFKSGILVPNQIDGREVFPETIDGYEVGVKTTPARGFTANFAAYYNDARDIQATSRDALGNAVQQNAGGAEIYGIEVDLRAKLTPNFEVFASGSLLHAKYTEFLGAQVNPPRPNLDGNTATFIDASGNTVVKMPNASLTLGGSYTHDLFGGELRLSGNLYHAGETYFEFSNRLRQGPYTIVNARASWMPDSERYRLSVFSENLFNTTYLRSVVNSTSGDMQLFNPPRTVGVSLEVFFD